MLNRWRGIFPGEQIDEVMMLEQKRTTGGIPAGLAKYRQFVIIITIILVLLAIPMGIIYYLPIHHDNQWNSIVRLMATNTDQAAIKTFLKKYDVDFSDRWERYSLLHLAVIFDREDVVAELLLRKANALQFDDYGLAPIHYAICFGYSNIAEQLLSYCDCVNLCSDQNNPGRWYPVHVIANKLFIKDRHSLCFKKKVIYQPAGNESIDYEKSLKLLLAHGADINQKNTQGETPLHIACEFSNIDIIKLLVANGADIKVCDEAGSTPFHKAIQRKGIEIVTYLLSLGVDVNAAKKNGNTPLHLLATHGYIEQEMKLLLDHGANVNLRNQEGRTPLVVRLKATGKYDEIVKLLIEYGSDLTIKDNKGMSAIDYAKKYGIKLEGVKDPITQK